MAGEGGRQRKKYTMSKVRELWTEEEHAAFLAALAAHGRDWKKIQQQVATKNVVQIRSHAQKYFIKVMKNKTGEHIPPPRPKRPRAARQILAPAAGELAAAPLQTQQTLQQALAMPDTTALGDIELECVAGKRLAVEPFTPDLQTKRAQQTGAYGATVSRLPASVILSGEDNSSYSSLWSSVVGVDPLSCDPYEFTSSAPAVADACVTVPPPPPSSVLMELVMQYEQGDQSPVMAASERPGFDLCARAMPHTEAHAHPNHVERHPELSFSCLTGESAGVAPPSSQCRESPTLLGCELFATPEPATDSRIEDAFAPDQLEHADDSVVSFSRVYGVLANVFDQADASFTRAKAESCSKVEQEIVRLLGQNLEEQLSSAEVQQALLAEFGGVTNHK
uniref:Uncharacterized protein n=1 Tax=Erythrolobus australicus TaxID=1077150 RepID=A0A7S1TLT6_9RHOD